MSISAGKLQKTNNPKEQLFEDLMLYFSEAAQKDSLIPIIFSNM